MDTTTEVLPTTAQQCRTLKVWRELVLGKSQRDCARLAGVVQSRISEVEIGKVMPRKRHWQALIAGYQKIVTNQDGTQTALLNEAEFYRMVATARGDWKRQKALQQPIDDTPLFKNIRTDEPEVSDEEVRRLA